MSDETIRDEMADMRQPRKPAQAKEEKSDKAQTARKARLAKMANKNEPAPTSETDTAVSDPVVEAAPPTPTILAEHTVASGDTLSHIAQKYYNSSAQWKTIYEANKDMIGDNPSLIRIGQVLTIPTLSS